MRRVMWCVAALIIMIAGACGERQPIDWQSDLDRLLATTTAKGRDVMNSRIARSAPGWQEVAAHVRGLKFGRVVRPDDGIVLRESKGIDGRARPWVIYVPTSYTDSLPQPLLVVLHGGVSRSNIMDDPRKHAREHYFTKLGEEHGWLVCFPSGQAGATWWDRIGMGTIAGVMHEVKRDFNVDDDYVWMAGFSDGGSGVCIHSMMVPTAYAAFVALNCNMAIGAMADGLQTYINNVGATPVYAVSTDEDRLFPTKQIQPIVDLARSTGADITYHTYPGGHDLSYGETELPLIATFLETHRRQPFSDSLSWETADSAFGLCRWFAIDRVNSEEATAWHNDYNLVVSDPFGRRGLLFRRDKPSARADVTVSGNRVDITASRLAKCRILVSPELFRLEEPISVFVNGEPVFSGIVEPEVGYMLRRFLDDRDRRLLYVNEIVIEL